MKVKQQRQLEQVVIRIAGDSGDGMQLTGDRFTAETASFGNDLSTLPNFPGRDPRSRRHSARRLVLPAALRRPRHPDPGDRPDVLVAMNPAALKANLADLPRDGVIIVDTHDFTPRALAKVGWPSNPIEDGTLDRFQVHAIDLTRLTTDALEGTSLSRKDAQRSKNMFALGLLSWLYSRPTEGTLAFLQTKFADPPRHRRRQHRGLQGRLELRRDHGGVRGLVRDQAGATGRGHLPQHDRQPGAVLRTRRGRPARPAAAVPRRLPDHAGLGHPARAEQAQAVRRPYLPGRGRDRRHRCCSGRVVRRGASASAPPRARHRAQERDHRPGGVSRAAAGDLRHPARRPVDRPADQDRAVRPAAGDVRPQRRGAGAGDRRPVPG